MAAAPAPRRRSGAGRGPIETIALEPGCDFKHWLVVMEPPSGDPNNPDVPRDEIIDSYIKTLAQVVGRYFFAICSYVLHTHVHIIFAMLHGPVVHWHHAINICVTPNKNHRHISSTYFKCYYPEFISDYTHFSFFLGA